MNVLPEAAFSTSDQITYSNDTSSNSNNSVYGATPSNTTNNYCLKEDILPFTIPCVSYFNKEQANNGVKISENGNQEVESQEKLLFLNNLK